MSKGHSHSAAPREKKLYKCIRRPTDQSTNGRTYLLADTSRKRVPCNHYNRPAYGPTNGPTNGRKTNLCVDIRRDEMLDIFER